VGFEPNDMGLTLALALPLAMYLTLRERRPLRWVYSAAAVLVIAALLLTASRTAFAASIVAFGFAVWTWRESDGAQRIANAALFGLLVLGVLYLAPPASRRRLATLPSEAALGTFHDRTYIWKAGVNVVLSHPLRGVGAGAFPEAGRPWLRISGLAGRYVAHNTFLSVLAEEGLIGFGVCALLLGTLMAYVWMMPSAERALWFVTLAVWALGVMMMTWEHRKPVWLFFGLIMTEWARSFRGSGVRQ
jgi:O-antigen ligase